LLFTLSLHVPSTLVEHLTRPLSRGLNLLKSTALLAFEQQDAIREQAQVILGTFSSEFGSHQFLMQRCIVILLVGSEVDVLILLAVVKLLLLIAVHVVARTAAIVCVLLLVLIVVVLVAAVVAVWTLLVILVQIVLHIIKRINCL
jgi:hypothetical protein